VGRLGRRLAKFVSGGAKCASLLAKCASLLAKFARRLGRFVSRGVKSVDNFGELGSLGVLFVRRGEILGRNLGCKLKIIL